MSRHLRGNREDSPAPSSNVASRNPVRARWHPEWGSLSVSSSPMRPSGGGCLRTNRGTRLVGSTKAATLRDGAPLPEGARVHLCGGNRRHISLSQPSPCQEQTCSAL